MITFRMNKKGGEQNKTETQKIFMKMMEKSSQHRKGLGEK